MAKDEPKSNIVQPGPVLKRATHGDYKKGKRPKEMKMSATKVADACAKAWGK